MHETTDTSYISDMSSLSDISNSNLNYSSYVLLATSAVDGPILFSGRSVRNCSNPSWAVDGLLNIEDSGTLDPPLDPGDNY